MAFLNQGAIERLFTLGTNGHRPTRIIQTKRTIEREMRLAEEFSRRTGMIDFSRIHVIVALKLRLDRLYAEWAGGYIS